MWNKNGKGKKRHYFAAAGLVRFPARQFGRCGFGSALRLPPTCALHLFPKGPWQGFIPGTVFHRAGGGTSPGIVPKLLLPCPLDDAPKEVFKSFLIGRCSL